MEWCITILAVVRFYSRFVIRKLPQNYVCKFRKVENEPKSYFVIVKRNQQKNHKTKLRFFLRKSNFNNIVPNVYIKRYYLIYIEKKLVSYHLQVFNSICMQIGLQNRQQCKQYKRNETERRVSQAFYKCAPGEANGQWTHPYNVLQKSVSICMFIQLLSI